MSLHVNYARSGAFAFISDRLSTRVALFGARRPAFQLCGLAGLLLMSGTMMLLAFGVGLSPLAALLLTVISAGAFLGYALAWKMIAGYEEIVYFRGLAAVILVDAAMLALLGFPLLRYLDILALGIGVFSICGRAGCGMVGCCHGLPCRHGIRYREEHAREGFPSALVGVPLVPVQQIEMLWLALVVTVEGRWLLRGAPPGSIFAGYLVAYSIGRFALEIVRGDPERPYRLGLSEAQWTAAIVTALVALGETVRLFPRESWHLVANGVLLLAAAFLILRRHLRGDAELFTPPHLLELAAAIRKLDPRPPLRPMAMPASRPIPVATTTLGLTISASLLRESEEATVHFAISRHQRLRRHSVLRCARFAAALLGVEGEIDILDGRNGVWHVLIHMVERVGTQAERVGASRVADPALS